MKSLIQNIDYELIPDPNNEEWWKVRILTGEFTETVIQYSSLKIQYPYDEKSDEPPITFSFTIIETPQDGLNEDDMAHVAAPILQDIVLGAVEREIKDHESGKSLGNNTIN